ncbi:unnamed protein product [Cylicostephanus goldi]|uniref:G-protein coupled receptors family 1 profile domain-containing protein n=1 Tax=Cylicostephanus goldi TaxID=71465 RepID=A0A3P6QQE0_CYLGO|nr:unnamed protein product [Cylicostephanus goldi]
MILAKANALMGASVWIVVFLTLSQYMADALPDNVCPYIVCDTIPADWFMVYETVRELISRIFPFFLVAYMNAKILITYRFAPYSLLFS